MFVMAALIACNSASESELSESEARMAAALDEVRSANRALTERLSAAESELASLRAASDDHGNRLSTLESGEVTQAGDIDALRVDVDAVMSWADDATTTLDATDARLGDVESSVVDLLAFADDAAPFFEYVEVDPGSDSVAFVGANLFVQSGSGSTTGAVNGLGNLIVGYNEAYTGGAAIRTGSHNFVLGTEQRYSGYGAIIAGYQNYSSAAFASVLGGSTNTASGVGAVVVGGEDNMASGTNGAVLGGYRATASGSWSAVVGGANNTADNGFSVVLGGQQNTSSGGSSAVLGGYKNTAAGDYATVYGGQSQTASTSYAYKP